MTTFSCLLQEFDTEQDFQQAIRSLHLCAVFDIDFIHNVSYFYCSYQNITPMNFLILYIAKPLNLEKGCLLFSAVPEENTIILSHMQDTEFPFSKKL